MCVSIYVTVGIYVTNTVNTEVTVNIIEDEFCDALFKQL